MGECGCVGAWVHGFCGCVVLPGYGGPKMLNWVVGLRSRTGWWVSEVGLGRATGWWV